VTVIRPRSAAYVEDPIQAVSELPPFPLLLASLGACSPGLQWAAVGLIGEGKFDTNPHWEWKAWLVKTLEGKLGLRVGMETSRKGRIVAARVAAGEKTDGYGCGYEDGSGVGVGCGYGNASADGYGYGDGDQDPPPPPPITAV
jgi:hypothetical protein